MSTTILSPTIDTAYVHAGRRLLANLTDDWERAGFARELAVDLAAVEVAEFLAETVATHREVTA